ncbi:MAG: YraN family protein [Chloroflexi bacterium]|nr:YraN family protein [Chloroflexota bacterium]
MPPRPKQPKDAGARPEDPRRGLGRAGEDLAAEHLRRQGYRLVARNVRLPGGEIDIVAQEGDCLVLVEVRTRRGARLGTPEESITPAKKERLCRLADAYLATLAEQPSGCRMDVVAVEMTANGRLLRVELHRDALA